MTIRKALLAVIAAIVLSSPATAQNWPDDMPAELQQRLQPQVYAIRAGHLVDPATATVADNQVIVTQHNHRTGDSEILAVGPAAQVEIPDGAEVIDLSDHYVLPGLVDSHDHLAITYKDEPESNQYYFTIIMDSSPIRAIQAVSNGIQKLASGFTVVRDLGNNGLYADTALRHAIEQGWVPGPTIINSGIIIGAFGGQFFEIPEYEETVYPEYLNADTNDEIVKAVRRNIHYGARVIKVCVDCQRYPYTVDQLRLFVSEAANAGQRVAGHVQTYEGARRAIEAGFWSLEHANALTDDLHKMMAEKGIYRAGTETPYMWYRGSERGFQRTVAGLRNAYENDVRLTFSTDADYYVPGLHRGEVTINFLETWKAAEIPAPDILRAMTTNGYAVCEIEDERGPITEGFAADVIAVRENPLENIDALRDMRFVMKDGLVFKRDGVVTPMIYFHSGPEHGWRVR